MIRANQVPPILTGYRILAVNHARLLDQVQDRAQLDARLNELLAALRADKTILFFDDVQNLSRATELGAQIGDVLGRFIASNRLVISATTPARFRQFLDRDTLIERECQIVNINEPTIEHTVEMLKQIREQLEAHYSVSIADGGLKAAAAMAPHHRPDRALPGSAIDIVDDAASMLALDRTRRGPGPHIFDVRIAQVRRDKESAIDAQDFERAAQLRGQEKQLLEGKQQQERAWRAGELDVVYEVDEDDVAMGCSGHSSRRR